MPDLKRLDNTIKELEKQSNDLKNFNSIYAEIAGLKKDISDNLHLLKENNTGLKDITRKVENRLDDIQKKIDEIYKDNKSFQKELDASVASLLEKNKSDIQVEIRNEGAQIQRSFTTALDSNFNQMEKEIRKDFEKQAKQFTTLKITTFILIALSTGIAVGLFVIQ